MKKKEDQELSEKLIELMLFHELDQTKLIIAMYEEQLKFYNILYEDTLKDEPLKFFKSKHKDWEQRRQNLYRHICHIETNYGDELQELEKIMDQLYGKKKKGND